MNEDLCAKQSIFSNIIWNPFLHCCPELELSLFWIKDALVD